MKTGLLRSNAVWALFVLSVFGSKNTFAVAAADSVAFAQGDYVVTKRSDANGWIYRCADTAAQTNFEVVQTGGILKKFIVYLHGVHFSVINEANGIPKMMPWPNRTASGKFTDDNGVIQDLLTTPVMTQNDGAGNAIHGMVAGRPWHVAAVGADSEGVYLHCYFDTQGWPIISGIFGEFRDHTVYHLKGSTLIIDAFTQNNSNTVFADCGWGFHPWINAPVLPLEGAQKGSRDRCGILMPADSIAMVTSSKIPTGQIQDVASYQNGYFNFNSLKKLSTVTVDNFFTGLKPLPDRGYTRSLLIDFGNRVRLQMLGQFPFYPWMVMYTPSSMVCIEHQTEEVNGLNTKQRLIRIAANATSQKGRVIVVADDDTTTDYKPVTAISRNVFSDKSINPARGGVSFSSSTAVVRLEKSGTPIAGAIFTPQGRRVERICKLSPGVYFLKTERNGIPAESRFIIAR
jgi:galactose mutarotase-like enzyme